MNRTIKALENLRSRFATFHIDLEAMARHAVQAGEFEVAELRKAEARIYNEAFDAVNEAINEQLAIEEGIQLDLFEKGL